MEGPEKSDGAAMLKEMRISGAVQDVVAIKDHLASIRRMVKFFVWVVVLGAIAEVAWVVVQEQRREEAAEYFRERMRGF